MREKAIKSIERLREDKSLKKLVARGSNGRNICFSSIFGYIHIRNNIGGGSVAAAVKRLKECGEQCTLYTVQQ